MPVALPSRRRPLLRKLVREPWTRRARLSPALRRWCGDHHYLTPHFSILEMADTQTSVLPMALRGAARRHCFNLERFRRRLSVLAGHPVAIKVDGPTRTREHNAAIRGAIDSQHVHGCASDHFRHQVDGWAQAIRRRGETMDKARARVVREAERIFPGVGNETSGTLHLDSRIGRWARFVTWAGAR